MWPEADVDLIGPGPAYERWKKTPEYQRWLNRTEKIMIRGQGQWSGNTSWVAFGS